MKQRHFPVFNSTILTFFAASRQLTAAIDHTGDAYNDIGVMFERQVVFDYQEDFLHEDVIFSKLYV